MVVVNYMKSIIAQTGKGSDQRSNETLIICCKLLPNQMLHVVSNDLCQRGSKPTGQVELRQSNICHLRGRFTVLPPPDVAGRRRVAACDV